MPRVSNFLAEFRQVCAEEEGGEGGGREEGCIDGNRCKLEARFLSARRRASKFALFILLVENGVEIFGKKEKLFGW